jgi:hypothetical protein
MKYNRIFFIIRYIVFLLCSGNREEFFITQHHIFGSVAPPPPPPPQLFGCLRRLLAVVGGWVRGGQSTISCMGRRGRGGVGLKTQVTDRMGPIVHGRAYCSLMAHKNVIRIVIEMFRIIILLTSVHNGSLCKETLVRRSSNATSFPSEFKYVPNKFL